MKKIIDIFINDKQYQVEEDKLLIEICRENNIYIPSLCYFPGETSFAGCRLCLVEIKEGSRYKLVASCEYHIRKTQHFYTDSERVRNSRRISAELLLARVPSAKELLEDIIKQPLKEIFPKIKSANDKCLLCGLCYRACEKFGPAAINSNGRGALKVVSTPYNEANVDCVACGICASICPTNAIDLQENETSRRIWQQRSDLISCPSCGKRHITKKTLQFLVEELGLPEKEMLLCEDCRQTTLSKEIERSFFRRNLDESQ